MCPVFRSSGKESHTARAKLHLLDTFGLGKSSRAFVDIFSACLLCGACQAVCPRKIDITKELVAARESFSAFAEPHAYEKYLTRKLLDFPGSLTGFRVLGKVGERLLGDTLPEHSGLRQRLAIFRDDAFMVPSKEREPQGGVEGTKLTWFPGCASRYLFPDILAACTSLLAKDSFALDLQEDLVCCGLADWAAGDLNGSRKSARKNIEILEARDGPILVSCASCFAQLKQYPALFADNPKWKCRAENVASRVVELSHFLEVQNRWERIAAHVGTQKTRVFYHDPCHLRYGTESIDKAREQLQRTERFEVVELPGGPRCCGQGGLFHVAHPEVSIRIRDELVRDVLALQPDIVTSTCSGCLMQWRQGVVAAGSTVRVLHLAQLLE